MPAPVLPADKRNPQLLTVLFWIGVALAPVAALILLVADGNGPLRFAAVLAILSVVLIGLSIALRADGDGGAARTEALLDEIEQLRRELRGEIVATAQRGNQALDQSQRAQEQVAALRRRLDAAAAAVAGAAADEPASAGRARVPAADASEEIPAGRGRFAASDEPESGWGRAEWQDDDEPARRPQPTRYGGERPSSGQAGVYGADASAYAADRPAPPAGYGADGPAQSTGYGAERPVAGQAGVYGAAPRPPEHDSHPPAPGPEHAPRPVGMVRHTETVHVTTRHTIVDGPGADPVGGNLHGGGYAGRWSTSAPGPEDRAWGGHASEERSWGSQGQESEDRSRPGYAGSDDRARPADDRSWDGQRDDRGRSAGRDDRAWPGSGGQDDDRAWSGGRDDDRAWSGGQRDDRAWPGAGDQSWGAPAEQPARGAARPDDMDGDYWSELRAGDRWAAVRDDERGREVRVGERRAAVHADGAGTEYRVEDRWAAVRQGEPRRGSDRGGDDGWRGDRAEESRPALPVGGVPVPDEWRPPAQRNHRSTGEWRAAEPEPDRLSRHQRAEEERYGYPPRDEVPRAGGAWR